MVDIERDVPGKTAENVWHRPMKIACTMVHLFDIAGAGLVTHRPGIDHPHDHAADEQREGHHLQAFQVLADHFLE